MVEVEVEEVVMLEAGVDIQQDLSYVDRPRSPGMQTTGSQPQAKGKG